MNEIIKSIKEIHKEDICLFRIGTFYHVFGRDSYIMSYLFGYKMKNNNECGFPKDILFKVEAKLERNNINYLVIDARNNYDVENKENFKNNNKYKIIYEKANKYINLKKRIENINKYLLENIEEKDIKPIIQKIEDVIDERREI